MAISKKGKKKLKSAISKKMTQKQIAAQSVKVSVRVGDTKSKKKKKKKKKTSKPGGRSFYTHGLDPGFGGQLGGAGYGTLGMSGFQNPYASADLVAQTAQRAVYDALGNRTIVGERGVQQAPAVAEQQAAVVAQEEAAQVVPVRGAVPIPLAPRRRDEGAGAAAEVALAEAEGMERLRAGRQPAVLAPSSRRGLGGAARGTHRGEVADLHAGAAASPGSAARLFQPGTATTRQLRGRAIHGALGVGGRGGGAHISESGGIAPVVRSAQSAEFEGRARGEKGQPPPGAPPARRRPRVSAAVIQQAQVRAENQEMASEYGGYMAGSLRKTRNGRQSMSGVNTNAQAPGSGGGSAGLLATPLGSYSAASPAPSLAQSREYEERLRRGRERSAATGKVTYTEGGGGITYHSYAPPGDDDPL